MSIRISIPPGPYQNQEFIGGSGTSDIFADWGQMTQVTDQPSQWNDNGGALVQTVEAWADTYAIYAVRITLTNGYIYPLRGRQSGQRTAITLAPGETLTSALLWPSQDGTCLGRIKLTTSAGQTFDAAAGKVGNTTYVQNLGSGFLSGVAGSLRQDGSGAVENFGLIMLNPVTSVTISQIDFGSNDPTGTTVDITPVTLQTENYTYDGKEDYTYTFQGSANQTTETSYTSATTQTFGASVSVEAGFLDIGKVTASASWSMSSEETSASSVSDTYTQTWGTSGLVNQENGGVTCSAICAQGKLNLPYSCVVVA